MKFQTTCSQCGSVFRLTPEQLEAAQGWAQCSVCGAAFNARSTLAAENGDPLPLEVELPLIEETLDPESVSTPAAVTLSVNPHPSATQTPDPTDPAPSPEVHAVPQLAGIENRAGGPDLTSIILIDPDAEVTDDYGPLPNFLAINPDDGGSAHATSGSVYGPTYTAATAVAYKPVKQAYTADSRAEPQKAVTRVTPTRPRVYNVIWGLASLVLVLVLFLQSVFFLRNLIASQAPVTRPWLEAACAKIGCSLSLPKDAELIQILGSDLQAEPAGPDHLQLKLTLGNRAAYAQAWPVLVLTLTDARDQAQARRSFAPSEYLADQRLLASGIPAQSEHPLSLPLEVRNLTMAGYRLELTY